LKILNLLKMASLSSFGLKGPKNLVLKDKSKIQ